MKQNSKRRKGETSSEDVSMEGLEAKTSPSVLILHGDEDNRKWFRSTAAAREEEPPSKTGSCGKAQGRPTVTPLLVSLRLRLSCRFASFPSSFPLMPEVHNSHRSCEENGISAASARRRSERHNNTTSRRQEEINIQHR